MAFADPQTITINAVPLTLNRIRTEGTKSVYATADENVTMTISHQESKSRTRRMVRIDKRVVATDPLSSVNEYKTLGVYMVIDEPEFGFSDDDIDKVVAGINAFLSSATTLKVLSSQH